MNFLKDIFSKQWHERLIREAKKQGANEGKHGRPAPSSIIPDVFEENFRNEGSALILKANSRVTDFIKKTSPAVSEANAKLDDFEAEARNPVDLDALNHHVQSVRNDSRTPLTNAHVKIIETEGYLNSFKATHNVQNAPDYPSDTMHFLSIVFIVLIIEGCLNAVFWKNDGGLLGGFFTALGVAGINISLAMTVGLLFRYVNYKASWSFALGIGSLILGFLLIIGLNLKIAIFRTAHNLTTLSLPDFSSVFTDPSSALLFFVGLVFATLAAYKGYYLFGSIPGYQKVSKDYEEAIRNADVIEKSVKSDIDSSINSAKSRLSQLVRGLSETNKALNKIKAEVKDCKTNFDATSAEVFDAIKVVIKNYRQINSKSRPANIPTPEYFGEDLVCEYELVPSFHDFESHVEEVATRSDSLFTNISASTNEQIRSIEAFKAEELGPNQQLFIEEMRGSARKIYIDAIALHGGASAP